MAEITLDGIAKAYGANPQQDSDYALRPLHLVWRQGLAYALLGPSGCGKTTLLNIISGLVRPSAGRLLFDGKDVTATSTEKRNIAQVFQFPVIYDTMTVSGNLAFPLRNRGLRGPEVDARVKETAAMLGLTEFLDRPARNLSADAKQKISLGRGLVRQDVAAVLFDEPLTVIDPGLKWELRSKLKAVHRALDLLMIYVTHDQTEALTFADQVVVMNGGQVLQVGTPAELFDRPDHTFVGHFIGSPGMNLLPACLDGDAAIVAGHRVPLANAYAPHKGCLQLGIRPDFATLGATGLPVTVDRIDDLGRMRLARIRLAGHPLVATIPPGATIDGAEARLTMDPTRIHLYAKDRRISPIARSQVGMAGLDPAIAPTPPEAPHPPYPTHAKTS